MWNGCAQNLTRDVGSEDDLSICFTHLEKMEACMRLGRLSIDLNLGPPARSCYRWNKHSSTGVARTLTIWASCTDWVPFNTSVAIIKPGPGLYSRRYIDTKDVCILRRYYCLFQLGIGLLLNNFKVSGFIYIGRLFMLQCIHAIKRNMTYSRSVRYKRYKGGGETSLSPVSVQFRGQVNRTWTGLLERDQIHGRITAKCTLAVRWSTIIQTRL